MVYVIKMTKFKERKNRMNKYWFSTILFYSIIFPNNAYADIQATHGIEQVAYEYAIMKAQERFDNPQVEMSKLDSRLRLQSCDKPLTAFGKIVNTGMGNQTVGVKCLSPVSWTVYVSVKVKVFQNVVVTTKALPTHHILTMNDVKMQPMDLGSLRQGYLEHIDQIIGQELKYTISLGSVIKPQNIRAQKIVHRGEKIVLVAAIGNMRVRMNGTALSNASLGERVRVKNSSSKRVVEGVVEAAGVVKIIM